LASTPLLEEGLAVIFKVCPPKSKFWATWEKSGMIAGCYSRPEKEPPRMDRGGNRTRGKGAGGGGKFLKLP